MGEGSLLRMAQVGDQTARRPAGVVAAVQAERLEPVGLELIEQRLARRLELEAPWLAPCDR